MITFKPTHAAGITLLTLTSLLAVGVGCVPTQSRNTSSSNPITPTTSPTEVTVPDEPTGTSSTDAAIVAETLAQMKTVQTDATDIANDIDASEDLESYTLPTSIPE